MKTRWTASTALSIIVMCIFSVPLLIVAYGFEQDWERDKAATMRTTLGLATACAERQKTFTTNTEILLRTLVHVPEIVQGNSKQISTFLKKLDVNQPDFAGFALFRPDGSSLVATLEGQENAPPEAEIIRSRQYFNLALQKNGFNVGEYLPAPNASHIPTLTMSMPVLNAKGGISGVMLAPLDLRRYDALITSLVGKTDDSVQLFDRNRILMYSYNAENEELQGSTVQNASIYQMMESTSDALVQEYTSPEGKLRVSAMVKLRINPDEPPYMYVYVTVPLPSAWNFVTTRYLVEMLGMLLAAMLAFGCAWCFGKVYFSTGLEKMAQVATFTEQGNYSMRIGDLQGCQEIQTLASAFDNMLNAMERSTALLHYQRSCLDFALEGGQMGTWEWDPKLDYCVLDARGLRILNYDPAEVGDKDVRDFIHPDDRKTSQSNMTLHFQGVLPYYHAELRLRHKDGRWLWVSLQGRVNTAQSPDTPVRVFGIMRDISQRKRIEELELEKTEYYRRISNIDSLTGLSNRRHFMEQAHLSLQQASRYGHTVAVVMADVDFFKKVNDTYGHSVGDALLKNFGQMLLEAVRQTDLVGRYGGEEFIFLLPQTSLEEARNTMEKVRAKIEHSPMQAGEHTISFTASFGLCVCAPTSLLEAHQQRDMMSLLEALIKCADACLYRAKAEGRNRLVCNDSLFDSEIA